MSARVIPLHPDVYLPLKFETPPFEAGKMREDYDDATFILQFAQQVRNEIFQWGKPLSKEVREAIKDMRFMIDDLGL